ncbi:MAG: NYN domain-containing protein [Lachnospiraceae bacterium]|nr:NYN domain-containing protein [Lachnospiraceae bacterium]
MKTAILIDGGFYRRRAQAILGDQTPEQRAIELANYCKRHTRLHGEKSDLYRIFYYDCPPSAKKIFHPFLQRQVDLSKSDLYKWTIDFYEELKKKRKFALRMGKLAEEQASYSLREDVIKKLCRGTLKFEDLTENDFTLNIDQKGVDMRIGLDISSMAFKQQVDQIILISGDSDFVPAAKHARREGIDFILDPLGARIKPDLFEHIDGLRTCDSRFTKTL